MNEHSCQISLKSDERNQPKKQVILYYVMAVHGLLINILEYFVDKKKKKTTDITNAFRYLLTFMRGKF